jgi:hypothetical protein
MPLSTCRSKDFSSCATNCHKSVTSAQYKKRGQGLTRAQALDSLGQIVFVPSQERGYPVLQAGKIKRFRYDRGPVRVPSKYQIKW